MMTTKPSLMQDKRWRERTHITAAGINLPLPPTPLIGREQQRAEATAILLQSHTRLLTLYGTGGVGKTRLAISVAADLADSFPDGVFFVPLQDITDPGLLFSAISQSLELYTLPDETILPTLLGYMRDMDALLLLDNFEQLTPAAPLLSELLSMCPRLKLLVTSRAILNLRGEQQLAVQPLPLPTTSPKSNTAGDTDLSEIENSPAVQLFVQRARSVKPGFKLDANNAADIAGICARLDGLPLAIELAAARIKFLSPKALLARLDKRLQVLTGGAQDLPTRQQTLHNTIHWSYELLTPTEQRTFRLLSVFSGGCAIKAAEAVCAGTAERRLDMGESKYAQIATLDAISSLANKSLLRIVEHDEDEARFVMLETIREYALEQLHANDEEASALASHALYMRQLAEEAESQLIGLEQAQWLNRLERELGNLRAALEWCASEGDAMASAQERLDTGLRIAGALPRYWQARGHLREGDDWLELLLARSTGMQTESREIALRAAGRGASNLGKPEQATGYYEEALEMARRRGDRSAIMLALMGLGNIHWAEGDWAAAREIYEECLSISTELDYKHGIAGALNNNGLVRMFTGDPTAVDYLERSVQLYRAIGDTGRASVAMNTLGRAHLFAGNPGAAEQCIREAFSMQLEIGDHLNIAYGLMSMAEVAGARKDYRSAARLLAAAGATHDDIPGGLDHFDTIAYASCLDKVRQALGKESFETEWARGLMLTPEEAMSGAIVPSRSATTSSAVRPNGVIIRKASTARDTVLTAREIELLSQLAQGLSNVELAERLHLSLYTVQAHLRNIFGKLNVSSRVAAVRYATEHGLV